MTIQHTNADHLYKQKVASSFSRAAKTYDHYARFQERVLEDLGQFLDVQPHSRWLDIGTGTGRALALLAGCEPSCQTVGLDLSESMLHQAQIGQPDSQLVCADAEALPFSSAVFDGLISSLAVQWCQHPSRLLTEFHRVLKDHGKVVFSTLLDGSMSELGQAWHKVDGRAHHNHYPTLEHWLEYAREAGFTVLEAQQKTVVNYYPNVKEAVFSLKKVGASIVTSNANRVTPSLWRRFEDHYQALQVEQGVPLSYEVGFIKLSKG